jgi:hypothetical protein
MPEKGVCQEKIDKSPNFHGNFSMAEARGGEVDGAA